MPKKRPKPERWPEAERAYLINDLRRHYGIPARKAVELIEMGLITPAVIEQIAKGQTK